MKDNLPEQTGQFIPRSSVGSSANRIGFESAIMRQYEKMNRQLKILITNYQLDSYTGTEVVVRDLALGLQALGHKPMVYSPRPGPIFHEIEAAGIPTVSNLD